ncbi:MAG: glycosyltransferase family 4 protein [Solirubrobacterales bacterium]
MRVQLVDPPAYTPPYDHALAAALARAGAEVELVTSHFPYGPVPSEPGYEVNELFYRRASREGIGPRRRRLLRAAAHLPDMRRYRRVAETADLVHYQWLPVPSLDSRLLPPKRPRVYTMHWRLPEAGTRIARSLERLLGEMDAVVVHSEHGARRLQADFGVAPERLRVIPHGAFDYLTRQPQETPLPEELERTSAPVILFFGLIRPYKGIDVLLEAFRRLEGAELWIVGMPRMPMGELHALADRAPGTVRFVERFVTDPEIPAFMRRADLVVLPYRNIEQSGVLYSALAFGRPLVLSDVGGFPEIAERGAARLAPAGDPDALAELLEELLGDRAAREALGTAAAAAAAGDYSWDRAAEATMALYRELLGTPR